ncbi:MAG: cofactor-independent phosphoglycerate mutase [Muribaculaceae bacterium]|nr:cofactor-independent phosphoglycerate mutase [Muribaculaceae bacterium]
MKYILILGDGMSDLPVEALNGKTPLQAANTPWFDFLAANGKTGLLYTIPLGFPPGSEVGNMSILGYDVKESFEGRGPLEAASIGYEMEPDDLAMRCNIIATDKEGNILNHHGGNLSTEDGHELIKYLNEHLGNDRVHFYPGIQYRHLLVIKGGKKDLNLFPPHDHVGENTETLLGVTLDSAAGKPMEVTALLLADIIRKSKDLLENHPINLQRKKEGKEMANLIWPWSEGYRPRMEPLSTSFPHIKGGVMITAVDLLKGIGHYAGLKPVNVPGATGLADTNYEGKAQAAIDALKDNDFVFVHVEATDEASHDRDVALKLKTIEFLDHRIVRPIVEASEKMQIPVRIALLPDHPTSVESGKHLSDPVPFVIYEKGAEADEVTKFDEESCRKGEYGTLQPSEFIQKFLYDYPQ